MKICVGLSGGVDSSVAALLLKRAGYDVFAMFMQNWHDTEGTLHGDCEWEEDKFVAELVARKIGIPFYFVDLSEVYRKRVVDYMFSEYEKGRTPNPDVLCNREIKFDAFLQKARQMGADMVATGHYCRRVDNPDGSVSLYEGVDPGKDQSYFLCQLDQDQLRSALFPIGNLLKSEVRALACEADLPSAEKKDSQGICFVGKVDLPVFLQQKLASREGEVIEVFRDWYVQDALYLRQQDLLFQLSGLPSGVGEDVLSELSRPLDYSELRFEKESYRSGKKHIRKTRWKANPLGCVAGVHEGAHFYTLGQRKGLAIGGHANPVFVIATDVDTNRVYVGEGETHPGLFSSCIHIAHDQVHWVRPSQALPLGAELPVMVRVRYRQELQKARLYSRPGGLYILFEKPQRSVTPGQFAVWYADNGDEAPELLGSGVI